MVIFGWFGGRRYERVGFELYGAAVAAARSPEYYRDIGVPDTLDGRFDLIGLHVALLVRHLRGLPPPGPALAQAVFDAMFNDMDINLRELGVGDLSVGRKVKAMWEAWHGRAVVYETALAQSDQAALEQALVRNVWRGAAPDAAMVAALGRQVRAQDAHLSRQGLDDLRRGRVGFLSPRPLAA